jgi:RND family efflux transporter MFP subunit
MRTILRLSAAFLVLLVAACGSSEKNEDKSVEGKKAELTKLKKSSDSLNTAIRKLEEEILKLDPSSAAKPKLIGVTPVAQQNFTHYIDLQGRITTDNYGYVSPRGQGGQVRAVYVKEGDYVTKGKLVMKLDDAAIRQQVEQAKINLSFAEDLYRRRKNLWDQNIGTEVELTKAKNDVANAQKQVELLQEQLSYTNVYAETSGVVEVVNVHVGEFFTPASAGNPANPNQVAIGIVNSSTLKATVDVPENYLPKITKGTPVIVEVPDLNKKFNSTISLVSTLINPSSRAFNAEAKLPADRSLKPNQVVNIKIQDYAVKNTVVIPMSTMQTDEKGKYVYVMATENGKKIARKKYVNVGEIYGENIEVRLGLATGDQLVTQGFQNLYEGQFVTTDTK